MYTGGGPVSTGEETSGELSVSGDSSCGGSSCAW